MSSPWAWAAIGGLGAFHGLNPAMGWLFAVALGLQRGSRRAVLTAIVPIAMGHAAAVAAAAALFVALDVVLDTTALRWGSAALLVAWALHHALRGHRARVRFGMRAGMAGLFAWSFLMATAHGAGLMLFPALDSLCAAAAASHAAPAAMTTAIAAVAAHTASMIFVTGAVALVVYQWVGVGVLRHAWINFDRIWTLALVATAVLIVSV